jgi:mitochondrial fission protein ELM1
VIALAEAIGLPFEAKQLTYNGWRYFGPRLLGPSFLSLTRASRDAISEEPAPDLTISAGHRSVAVVRELRRRCKGRMRSIHVGFPRVSPAYFDLVITTPQYPIADHPNLLRLPYALTRAATVQGDPAEEVPPTQLPSPRRLLVVGGPTWFWGIDNASLIDRLSRMLEEARNAGGSVLVTTSPRTPAGTRGTIRVALQESDVPTLLAAPGQPPRYPSLLASADSIFVTADSVAMVSDAIWTGKPVGLVPVMKSALGRILIGPLDAVHPGHHLYPQDLRFFWRALGEIGITERLGTPHASTKEVLRMVMDRVHPIIESLQ